MIKAIIFDADGVVVQREMYFSERFSREFGVPLEAVLLFFKNEFQLCLTGKADLKKELAKYLKKWNWKRSVDDLLTFWFEHESELDQRVLESVKSLRSKGIQCYLSTDNEKYRSRYLLDNLGLRAYFDGVFFSADIGFSKAQVEFWTVVLERLEKLDKREVLVWDDDEKNVEAARKFGFQAEFYSGFDLYEKYIAIN